jgi:hypothetical protein
MLSRKKIKSKFLGILVLGMYCKMIQPAPGWNPLDGEPIDAGTLKNFPWRIQVHCLE